MLAPFRSRATAARLADRVQAFDEHQPADNAKEDNVGEPHQEIDLAHRFQRIEQLNPEGCTDQAADQKHGAHPKIDRPALEVRKYAGEGRGDDLVRLGRHGDGGWNADEEQKRRHQETAADPEHARQDANHAAKPQQKEGVDRDFSDRKIDVHVAYYASV